jgi:hypothetical protein
VILPSTTTASSDSDPFESLSDFFNSGAWTAISLLVQVFIVALWFALIYWTYRDAKLRIREPGWIAASVALSVVIPYLGTIIYLLVRPPEYLDEARERELELLALERRLGELGDPEGQQLMGRIIDREGLPRGGPGLDAALREAGALTQDDLRDIDMRIAELDQRLRRAGIEGQSSSQPALPPPSDEDDLDFDPEDGDTGRTGRFRLRKR